MQRKKQENSIRYLYLGYICNRNHDLPAIIYSTGSRVWIGKNMLRKNIPYYIWNDGSKHWGDRTNSYLPVSIEQNGDKMFYVNGEFKIIENGIEKILF